LIASVHRDDADDTRKKSCSRGVLRLRYVTIPLNETGLISLAVVSTYCDVALIVCSVRIYQ